MIKQHSSSIIVEMLDTFNGKEFFMSLDRFFVNVRSLSNYADV